MCEGETERGNREWMIEEDKGERATKALIRRLITNRPAQSAVALREWMKWRIDVVSCDLCLCHVQIETSAHWIKRGHKAVLATVIEAPL